MSELSETLSQYWTNIQGLFPWLAEELDPLTEKQQQLVEILELVRIEEFLPSPMSSKVVPKKHVPLLLGHMLPKWFITWTQSFILRSKGLLCLYSCFATFKVSALMTSAMAALTITVRFPMRLLPQKIKAICRAIVNEDSPVSLSRENIDTS